TRRSLTERHPGGEVPGPIYRAPNAAGSAMRALLGALATTERRKRAMVLLVAAPLVLAIGAGAALGALAERGGWSAAAIVAIALAALAGAALAGRWLLATVQSVRSLQRTAWLPEKLTPLNVEVTADAPRRVNVIHPSI